MAVVQKNAYLHGRLKRPGCQVSTPPSILLTNQGRNEPLLCVGQAETESHQEKAGKLNKEEQIISTSALLFSVLPKHL